MGLPNQGANSVAINMRRYGLHDVPVTISVAPHPSKHGRDALEDVTSSIIALRNLLSVDRFEINTSCPNVAHKQRPTIAELLEVIQRQKLPSQEIYTGIIFRGTRLIRELREHYDRPACPSS